MIKLMLSNDLFFAHRLQYKDLSSMLMADQDNLRNGTHQYSPFSMP